MQSIEGNGIGRNPEQIVARLDVEMNETTQLSFALLEVRTRRGDAMGTPEESLTPRKHKRLIQVAQEFLAEHAEYAEHAWRIDLVAIELDRAGKVARMEVIKSAVEE